jgi:hypothetical protein
VGIGTGRAWKVTATAETGFSDIPPTSHVKLQSRTQELCYEAFAVPGGGWCDNAALDYAPT